MFNIRIIYDEIINNKDVPEVVVIVCINFGKHIGCPLENLKIEDFITIFVTNMLFQNIGLFWIIRFKKPKSWFSKSMSFLDT